MFEELEQSELGTREYWDNRYKNEIKNFKSHKDVGEIWFGEDIVDRIIRWMNKASVDKADKILDVGCGNGMLLVELNNEGFKNLLGIDYSENAISLAKDVSAKYQCNISFSVCNILDNNINLSNINIVLDKGTYDAISLSSEAKANRNIYIQNVYSFLIDTGILIITSCNWTKEELIEQFKDFFDLKDVVPTPEFKFGGKVGNVVTVLVFKKKNKLTTK